MGIHFCDFRTKVRPASINSFLFKSLVIPSSCTVIAGWVPACSEAAGCSWTSYGYFELSEAGVLFLCDHDALHSSVASRASLPRTRGHLPQSAVTPQG
ncbi:hypothetical protein LMH87_000280 [Akanthomyces muscarius]|uniref:Uncharacterized protein n=1 Tax=Akanthomyces muscarius TaxID=2231603 RepID=A0A9W8UNG8_AKAMU|nr:hypothetical protein LMH87_000280 [Akanthomyces muscarius]KAJ4155014.1 hypothetical protein LMH87_000280 [Akanthomyces muscarius]